jgi:hypothetical protein
MIFAQYNTVTTEPGKRKMPKVPKMSKVPKIVVSLCSVFIMQKKITIKITKASAGQTDKITD